MARTPASTASTSGTGKWPAHHLITSASTDWSDAGPDFSIDCTPSSRVTRKTVAPDFPMTIGDLVDCSTTPLCLRSYQAIVRDGDAVAATEGFAGANAWMATGPSRLDGSSCGIALRVRPTRFLDEMLSERSRQGFTQRWWRSVSGPSGGRAWWAHFEFTRINTTPTFLCKKFEDLREVRVNPNQIGPSPFAALTYWNPTRSRVISCGIPIREVATWLPGEMYGKEHWR